MNNNSNPNTKCINSQHLVLDEKEEKINMLLKDNLF